MYTSETIKPVSYFDGHLDEIINELTENRKTYVITQNGEAKAILVNIYDYEQLNNSMIMSKILDISQKDLDSGKYEPIDDAFADIDNYIKNMGTE